MQGELMRTVGDVRNGAMPSIAVPAKSPPVITISLRARATGRFAGRDGSQHGATDRTVKQNAENARQASQLALSASKRRNAAAKWWITWCRLCAISHQFAENRRYYQRN